MTLLQYPNYIVFPRPVSIPPLLLIPTRTHVVPDTRDTQIHISLSVHHRELCPVGGCHILRKFLSRILVPSGGFQMYATTTGASSVD